MPAPLQPDPRLTKLRKLTEVSRALTYAVSLDEVLRLAVERAAELLETDRSVLMLTNAEGLLSVRAAFGLDPKVTEHFREPLDETLTRRLQGLLRVAPAQFLGVPLVVNGAVTGILAVTIGGDGEITEEQEWLLSALADQAAVALEKTRLDEAGRFRERVIGIVSHNLRNPIGAILLGAHALLRREELDDRTTKTAARIQSSAERASRMIRDLLDYTQAHLGRAIPIERRPADLHAIARQAIEEVQAAHPQRHIGALASGNGNGHWDADRLLQVIGNLLSNAVDYSPADTVVRAETRGEDGWVCLSVHNDGAPIPADRLASIFEPMQRAALETNKASRSVGLGLYIVKHLVEAHGGTVSVHSTAGEGTTFTVRLPREPGTK